MSLQNEWQGLSCPQDRVRSFVDAGRIRLEKPGNPVLTKRAVLGRAPKMDQDGSKWGPSFWYKKKLESRTDGTRPNHGVGKVDGRPMGLQNEQQGLGCPPCGVGPLLDARRGRPMGSHQRRKPGGPNRPKRARAATVQEVKKKNRSPIPVDLGCTTMCEMLFGGP